MHQIILFLLALVLVAHNVCAQVTIEPGTKIELTLEQHVYACTSGLHGVVSFAARIDSTPPLLGRVSAETRPVWGNVPETRVQFDDLWFESTGNPDLFGEIRDPITDLDEKSGLEGVLVDRGGGPDSKNCQVQELYIPFEPLGVLLLRGRKAYIHLTSAMHLIHNDSPVQQSKNKKGAEERHPSELNSIETKSIPSVTLTSSKTDLSMKRGAVTIVEVIFENSSDTGFEARLCGGGGGLGLRFLPKSFFSLELSEPSHPLFILVNEKGCEDTSTRFYAQTIPAHGQLIQNLLIHAPDRLKPYAQNFKICYGFGKSKTCTKQLAGRAD